VIKGLYHLVKRVDPIGLGELRVNEDPKPQLTTDP
jgi:hypothetical protein